MNALVVISAICTLVLNILIFVYFIQNFKEINAYKRFGAVIVSLFILSEIVVAASNWSAAQDLKLYELLIPDLISIIKIYMYVCTGIHICVQLSSQDLPLIRMLFKEKPLKDISAKKYVLNTLSVSIGAIILTITLFYFSSAQISEQMKDYFKIGNLDPNQVKITFGSIFIFVQSAFLEEISFRLCIQNFLAHLLKLENQKYWIAIMIAAMIWTFAHGSPLNPAWLKPAQILPIGIALGLLSRKFGTESSIFAHVLFNIALSFISSDIVRI